MMNTFQSQLPKLIFMALTCGILSCNNSQKNNTALSTKIKDSISKTTQPLHIDPQDNRIHRLLNEINNFPNNNEVSLIKFHYYKINKNPPNKEYIRLTSSTPLQITSQEEVNDSTLFIKAEAIQNLQSFKGIIGCSNDTIYLSHYMDTSQQCAAAYIKYYFEYTIRIKKGKQYKLAEFKSK